MDALEARLANLPSLGKPLSGTGITSFIGGTLRANSKFCPRRYGKRVSKKPEDPLKVGRRADRLYQNCVAQKKRVELTPKTAHAYHAMKALREFGIKSIATQVPVQLGQLVSRLDGLGIYLKNGTPTVAVIELKTTARTLNDDAAYSSICRNKPQLDILDLDNSEKVCHDIQAEFGRLAFNATYGEVLGKPPCHSVVVIANSVEAGVREVKPIVPPNGRSLAVISSTANITPLLRAGSFSALPSRLDGGGLIRTAIRSLGYKSIATDKKKVPRGASCVALSGADSKTRTLFGIRPQFLEQSQEQQSHDCQLLKNIAARGGRPDDRLAVLYRHSGGWSSKVVARST